MNSGVTCQQCGNGMYQTTKAESNMGAQVMGVFVFVIAVLLLFVFPIGTFIGIFLMIAAARMGYKKRKIWMCRKCGYFFERAK